VPNLPEARKCRTASTTSCDVFPSLINDEGAVKRRRLWWRGILTSRRGGLVLLHFLRSCSMRSMCSGRSSVSAAPARGEAAAFDELPPDVSRSMFERLK